MSAPPFCPLGNGYYINNTPTPIIHPNTYILVPNASQNGDNPFTFSFTASFYNLNSYQSGFDHSFFSQSKPFFRMIRVSTPNRIMGISSAFFSDVAQEISGDILTTYTVNCLAQYDGVNTTLTMEANNQTVNYTYAGYNYHNDFTAIGSVGCTLTIESVYFYGSNWGAYGTPCLGTIPTHHEVAPDITVKLSHVRRIRGERSAQAAELVAEAMRRRYL